MDLRVNVGCGLDYREGWLNVDGSSALPRVDRVLEGGITPAGLLALCGPGSAREVLAQDFLEHFTHGEAVELLRAFHAMLAPLGTLRVRVPDAERILSCPRRTARQKLRLLFGGQDAATGDPQQDALRAAFPQYFVHKYGWVQAELRVDLERAGFDVVAMGIEGMNAVAVATRRAGQS